MYFLFTYICRGLYQENISKKWVIKSKMKNQVVIVYNSIVQVGIYSKTKATVIQQIMIENLKIIFFRKRTKMKLPQSVVHYLILKIYRQKRLSVNYKAFQDLPGQQSQCRISLLHFIISFHYQCRYSYSRYLKYLN